MLYRWLTPHHNVCAGDGPEVPVDPVLVLVFKRCFIDLLMHCATDPPSSSRIKEKIHSQCRPDGWLSVEKQVLSVTLGDHDFPAYMYASVHKDVGFSNSNIELRKADKGSVPFLSPVQTGV